jgi:hypothetical protein
MDTKAIDAISVITVLVLLPMVGVSGHAYWAGHIQFAEYLEMWRDPFALLLGFWLRGATKET